jgi:Flp pilus assembly protein TadB
VTGAWPAVFAAVAGLLLWSPPGRPVDRLRGRRVVPPPLGSAGPVPVDGPAAARRRWLLAGAAGLAVGLLLGGVLGIGAGLGIAVGGERLLRGEAPGGDTDAVLLRDLPGACDLLAVCLSAGIPVAGALGAVAEATPAPLGARLADVAALYRLGAEPRRAWADAPAALARLGRVLVRAGESGASVAPALTSLAADLRTAARTATEAGVRRAGVWILAPLGLCFLPAFVCLGVVPLVLGIAGEVFG